MTQFKAWFKDLAESYPTVMNNKELAEDSWNAAIEAAMDTCRNDIREAERMTKDELQCIERAWLHFICNSSWSEELGKTVFPPQGWPLDSEQIMNDLYKILGKYEQN